MKYLVKTCLILICIFGATIMYAEEEAVLVLGSGGTKGLAHVGVIEELENLGIQPKTIVGCSSGALVSVLYAQNRDITEAKECLMKLSTSDIIDFTSFNKKAVSERKKFRKFLDDHIQVENFSDLQAEVVIVVTNFGTGKSEYLAEGNIKDAILASCSLPGIFKPCERGGEKYIDGGLSDPLPIAHAKSLAKGKVIASDVSPALESFKDDTILDILMKSFEIIYQNLSSLSHKDADILLEMNFENGKSPIDGDNNEKFYNRGKELVREHTEEIRKEFSI